MERPEGVRLSQMTARRDQLGEARTACTRAATAFPSLSRLPFQLARALEAQIKRGDGTKLDAYSTTALRRIWKAQRFSWWMTSLLHKFGDETPFDERRQFADLEYLVSSRAALASLAENYVGLPFED
jgi:hypothetical protein